MLGIRVSLATIARDLPKPRRDPCQTQGWIAFLRNHRHGIAAMDFFVVPTVRFQLLYAWFVLDHGRRRVLDFDVTLHPTARWVIQQLREAFPDAPSHRHLIFDDDAIFSDEVVGSIASFGIEPRRTAFRSPWQNGTAERLVGTVRRELLDHVVVLDEDHVRRLLREYVKYHNAHRVHSTARSAALTRSRSIVTTPREPARAFTDSGKATLVSASIPPARDTRSACSSCPGRSGRREPGPRTAPSSPIANRSSRANCRHRPS